VKVQKVQEIRRIENRSQPGGAGVPRKRKTGESESQGHHVYDRLVSILPPGEGISEIPGRGLVEYNVEKNREKAAEFKARGAPGSRLSMSREPDQSYNAESLKTAVDTKRNR